MSASGRSAANVLRNGSRFFIVVKAPQNSSAERYRTRPANIRGIMSQEKLPIIGFSGCRGSALIPAIKAIPTTHTGKRVNAKRSEDAW